MSTVAVVNTARKSFIDDVKRYMKQIGIEKFTNDAKTVIKLNLSRPKILSPCSTTLYIFDAIYQTSEDLEFNLQQDRVLKNETVNTNIDKGEKNN